MDLVAYPEPWPDEAEELTFGIPNPTYAEELAALHAAREHNPFADDNVPETLSAELTDAPQNLVDADEICIAATEITLVVGYPFEGHYAANIHAATTSGFTRADLFRHVTTAIRSMYEGATYEPIARLDNMRVTSPRFGTALHVIEDLALEAVYVEQRADGRIVAWASIGS